MINESRQFLKEKLYIHVPAYSIFTGFLKKCCQSLKPKFFIKPTRTNYMLYIRTQYISENFCHEERQKLNKYSDDTGNKNNPPFTQESNIWSEFWLDEAWSPVHCSNCFCWCPLWFWVCSRTPSCLDNRCSRTRTARTPPHISCSLCRTPCQCNFWPSFPPYRRSSCHCLQHHYHCSRPLPQYTLDCFYCWCLSCSS